MWCSYPSFQLSTSFYVSSVRSHWLPKPFPAAPDSPVCSVLTLFPNPLKLFFTRSSCPGADLAKWLLWERGFSFHSGFWTRAVSWMELRSSLGPSLATCAETLPTHPAHTIPPPTWKNTVLQRLCASYLFMSRYHNTMILFTHSSS